MLRLKLFLIAVAVFLVLLAQASSAERKTLQPGVKEVQVPFQSLKPSVTFKIGKTADWVLVTDDAVWVGGSKPIRRVNAITLSSTVTPNPVLALPQDGKSSLTSIFAPYTQTGLRTRTSVVLCRARRLAAPSAFRPGGNS
jgi:hypothetical protein